MEIKDSVCIVTGASSGIGAATARLLSELGAHVVLGARRTDRLEALAANLQGALCLPTDVTRPDEFARLVAHTVENWGRVDVLVNNAGQGLHVPLEELEPADLRAVFELNVVAPLVGMQAVLPHMRTRSAGAIVNVSSATTLRVIPGLGGYAATKAALNMLSQVAREETAGAGISVSLVYPRLTATEFHERLRAGRAARGGGRFPADAPELVAAAIAFAIRTGEPHVLVEDPPRPITPGNTAGGGPGS
jgi:NADP-dependent 3-hydroxy acid dehydrogenase YdfG